LETWRDTTKLPWFGFWARELLRWGTLDPFVAFALAQGLARTRAEAAERRPVFERWLRQTVDEPKPEDLIDPQHFLGWQRSFPRSTSPEIREISVAAALTGAMAARNRYGVLPLSNHDGVAWLDAAGFVLARSRPAPGVVTAQPFRQDFELVLGVPPHVQRTFSARGT
jgi:hypothetical protein